MTIPFLDLHAAYRELQPEIDATVARVLDSGCYILGDEVEAFEGEYAAYVGAEFCIGVGNGFDALALGLKALGIGTGDEVIVPAHTFIATWMAVSDVGATPVPVEPDETTYTIDTARIEAAITERTRAIIPVHLYGHPADLDPILAIARRYGLRVLEDAAQAHGARYKGRRIGSHGDLVAWSFYPGKNLGAMGDAGGVTTDNAEIADRVRLERNYGSTEKYIHKTVGHNSRLDPIQAAILRVKLQYLDEWNMRRKNIASEYIKLFNGKRYLILPHVTDWADPVWHLFVVRYHKRDELQKLLAEVGIITQIHYPYTPSQQKVYRDEGYDLKTSKKSVAICKEILSLPIGPHLNKQQSDSIQEKMLSILNTIG